ncbi:sugar ABC transporter permease [Microbacterium sp. cx-55]|uniref:carbohydrate ABC transporter permease n=1 Tax=unclassified Microbacterium TaxID=2609290 RepID=UPI001CBF694C|nr:MULTISPECIES: sugar ABC transporter permease [unclassified Microbacterium]MBZ4487343.1 sugar ABC transporter permease [Microbacterium sp. cx-55]MCC4908536.1 sugar ABC transporter permease [Microbacterium sp. cx-59]UGB35364.1 sugar ABC transporter permease [Microbacterium sp. cx-55]
MTATLPSVDASSAAPSARRPATPERPAWRTRLSRADYRGAPYLYVAPFFLLFGLVGLFPLVYTLVVSLYEWDLLKGQGEFVGFGNFVEILGDGMFWNSVSNTISIFLLSSVPQLAVALVVAYLLDRGLRAPTFWRMSVLVPFVVTPVATALIFSSIFSDADGLVNNILNVFGIADQAWKQDRFLSHLAIATMVNFRWTGYNALILLAAMQAVPRDLYESAAIDGAGPVRRFFSITIPTIRPTLIFVIITATIGGLQIFAEPRLFDVSTAGGIGGSDRQFQTTVLFMWELAFFRRNFGEASAVAWLLFLLIVGFGLVNFLIARRISTTDSRRAAKARRARTRGGDA